MSISTSPGNTPGLDLAPELAALFEAVRANNALLDNCQRHKFVMDVATIGFGRRYKCEVCGGNMEAVQCHRYAQGYKAAGGNPNDIIEGYE